MPKLYLLFCKLYSERNIKLLESERDSDGDLLKRREIERERKTKRERENKRARERLRERENERENE